MLLLDLLTTKNLQLTSLLCMEVVVTLSQTHRDIGEILSTSHAFEKAVNRQYLMKIAENIRFLVRQGLSFLLAM